MLVLRLENEKYTNQSPFCEKNPSRPLNRNLSSISPQKENMVCWINFPNPFARYTSSLIAKPFQALVWLSLQSAFHLSLAVLVLYRIPDQYLALDRIHDPPSDSTTKLTYSFGNFVSFLTIFLQKIFGIQKQDFHPLWLCLIGPFLQAR